MVGCVDRRSSGLLLASAALTFIGCANPAEVPPDRPEPARLAISANVSATTIATMVVKVSGPGITIPLVFNLTISDGTASGSITVPAGSSRKLDLDAFDAKGINTHHGEKTINEVKPGSNPSITIVLLPMAGDQPVTASLGSFTVTVSPNPASVGVGLTLQFTAVVKDKDNNVVTPGPGELRWATTQPALFSVTATGIVTGILAGTGEVVATYNGVAGLAAVTVAAP
jgi:hypothetical protein